MPLGFYESCSTSGYAVSYMMLFADDDVSPYTVQSVFRNLTLYEQNAPLLKINNAVLNQCIFNTYDSTASYLVQDNGDTIYLKGNGVWTVPYVISNPSRMAISFDFKSSVEVIVLI